MAVIRLKTAVMETMLSQVQDDFQYLENRKLKTGDREYPARGVFQALLEKAESDAVYGTQGVAN